MKTIAVIPAGGKGIRIAGNKTGGQAKLPKQYLKINSKELIVYTLEIFQKNKLINEIVVAADPAYIKLCERLKKKYRLNKISAFVPGGNERQDSVKNVLFSLNAEDDDLVIVHDAARPLLSQNILTNAIQFAAEHGNAVVCIRGKDTLIKGKTYQSGPSVDEYLNREEIYYVQTPQIFRYADLLQAMHSADKNNFLGTDESMLVRRMGIAVNIVEGSPLNFKVTTADDLEMFKKLSARNR